MKNEKLSEKVKNLLKGLNDAEEIIDEAISDDEWLLEEVSTILEHPGEIFDPVYRPLGEGEKINVIPSKYGKKGECTDTLLVFVEPSFWILQGDECHPEMRLKKRIESSINFISICKEINYIVFWASIWEFRIWKKYEKYFTKQTIILKPWGLDYMILK